jgi:hypothetical protein
MPPLRTRRWSGRPLECLTSRAKIPGGASDIEVQEPAFRTEVRPEMQQGDAPTMLSGEDHRRLAVLIDADNAQPSVIAGLLGEVAKFGVAGVKRIYGDWTSTKHTQWKPSLLEHSITPIQQFAYTTGKNATDSSLIIDAMDLMYSRQLDGFCLVSSDSDFTRLAQRLREAGMLVYGFGERKTPQPFVVACDKFIYTEVLRKDAMPVGESSTAEPSESVSEKVSSASSVAADAARASAPKLATKLKSPVNLIAQAIEQGADESGWAFLGAVGNYLTKIQPDFDPRLYGCRKLTDLVRKYPEAFETSERGTPGSPSKVVYARAVPKKASARSAG